MRRDIVDRLTDWRLWASFTAFLVGVALVLFAIAALHAPHAAEETASAERAVIVDKQDQVTNLRHQRDVANTRADNVTRIALAGISELTCTEYRQAQTGAVFARLVFASPTATDDQRRLVAPFVKPPPKPRRCP